MDIAESHVSDYTNAFRDGVRQQIHLEKARRLAPRSFSCCMSATKDKPDGNNKYIDPVFRHKQDTTVSSMDRGYIRLSMTFLRCEYNDSDGSRGASLILQTSV